MVFSCPLFSMFHHSLPVRFNVTIRVLEYSTKVRTSFSKLKIMRTAIQYSTKKYGVLGDWPECMGSLISIGPLKKKCPNFYLSKHFYSTLVSIHPNTWSHLKAIEDCLHLWLSVLMYIHKAEKGYNGTKCSGLFLLP